MANKQQSPNPAGRPKGSANKIGQELQAMLKASFSRVGGIEYLVKQAEENPTAYMTMISKLLPKQVEASIEHSGELNQCIEIVFRESGDS